MITVQQALEHVFALVRPLSAECVPLRDAAGRVLAEEAIARRTQPPFAASAMDGYAIAVNDAKHGDQFRVVGESAAGKRFSHYLGHREAVRIFTGAPLPNGATRVVIQEDVTRDDDVITLQDGADTANHIRPAGIDFQEGDSFAPDRPLRSGDIALLAAMGHVDVLVRRRPDVALIATGNELVMPGEAPDPDQIVASNTFGLAAMIERAGGIARVLPIARDSATSLSAAFDLACGADLVITIGGASVGDHDLVADVAAARGMERAFHKIAMRPGKPLMAGRIDGRPMIGLPGNPVSSMVCGLIFILPALRAMQGLPPEPAPRQTGTLSAPLGASGPREHYMRASLTPDGLVAFDSQDSSRLRLLAEADALIVRPPHDPPREIGDTIEYIALDGA